MRIGKCPLLLGTAIGITTLAACSSAPATPISSPSTPSQSASAAASTAAATTASSAAAGSGVHHITLTQDDDGGSTYRVTLDVTLGTPTLDSADANPGTTDISIPMTLDSGTLTNTSSGGLQDNPDGMPYSFFIGPALSASSFTCTTSQGQQWPKLENLAPYAGCGAMSDNVLLENSNAESKSSGMLPAGQSEPLDLLTGTSKFSNPNVNVPTPDAKKVAAELAAGKVFLVITGPNTGSAGSIEGKSLAAGACG